MDRIPTDRLLSDLSTDSIEWIHEASLQIGSIQLIHASEQLIKSIIMYGSDPWIFTDRMHGSTHCSCQELKTEILNHSDWTGANHNIGASRTQRNMWKARSSEMRVPPYTHTSSRGAPTFVSAPPRPACRASPGHDSLACADATEISAPGRQEGPVDEDRPQEPNASR